MTIRIPRPVNVVLDRLGRHPALTAVASLAAALGALSLVHWSAAITVAYGVSGVVAGACWRRDETADLRDERDALLREVGRQDEELRRIRLGDACSMTAQIHTIPEEGSAA